MRQAIGVSILALSLCACNRDRYTVIERTNGDSEFWVRVVLLHDGHKLHVECNNYKGTKDPNKIEHCKLHVGQRISCKFFPDRLSRDAYGYDLICGEELVNGKLTSSGGNELLIIDKEEQ